ncbi:hypothetical protein WH8501_12665 [Crocosphaera watsonii WH 8501]|uniref:Uncharacterized protein n=6 Tax=Crocosphaera watsonii TaxID=263511 RepID=Q4C2L0_CROWT|nr:MULTISPECIES: hypothetical protein [Crocosphaera]EAM50396.1 hypothetical protein CwatDRAFT_3421 [Crocosphaera watsonii WH 8501]EHJ11035.1 hypothetical protein CWATWH0003_4211 [Crocosphaera watsonii WH 0003]MCH2244497.1 hypothetical protein [Crocosphaera sp.]NQZ62817.1 hypothetical protein [Crocosphaera sp.]CCQ52523.1 hypothetical protein CWATWH8502_4411 [Crocosphaera watsonii WH 8502]
MLSPELDLVNNWILTEIWIDSTAIPPYILVLLGDEQDNFAIYDPKENYQLIYACSSYEEAKLWFLEDEYERVEGRILIEKFA